MILFSQKINSAPQGIKTYTRNKPCSLFANSQLWNRQRWHLNISLALLLSHFTSQAFIGLCLQRVLENPSQPFQCVNMLSLYWNYCILQLLFRATDGAGGYLKEWWTCTDFHLIVLFYLHSEDHLKSYNAKFLPWFEAKQYSSVFEAF